MNTPRLALIIDDSPGIRAIIVRYLTLLGITNIETAENGAIGVEKARALKPDFIILDGVMPVMDGFAALVAIKSALPNTVVVVSSAEADAAESDRFRDAGADFYLPKPYNKSTLAEVVRQAFEIQRFRKIYVN